MTLTGADGTVTSPSYRDIAAPVNHGMPEVSLFGSTEGVTRPRTLLADHSRDTGVARLGKLMAIYKYDAYVTQANDAVFDSEHSPSTPVPRSGIYRCMGCGREVACNQGDPLPPQNHHQHTQTQGTIRWRLVVYADHREK